MSLSFTPSIHHHDDTLPTVAIFTTGGTICQKTNPKTGASIPLSSKWGFLDSIPELRKLANYRVIHFSNIDSSHMTPEIWAKLSKAVDEVLVDSAILGAVITHGTDTMEDGSFFLDLTLKTEKSVVFTGAMRNASNPYSDGPLNLINAVSQVLSPRSRGWGVTLTMNQYVHSPFWVEKTNTTNVQTFSSGDKGALGYVYNPKVIYRYNSRLFRIHLPVPETLPKVAILYDYAGSTGNQIISLVDDEKIDGLVIVGVGAGNVNREKAQKIQYALNQKVTVVLSTRVSGGGVIPAYGDVGGGEWLEGQGVILSGHFSPSKARLLLMLALPIYKDNPEKLRSLFDLNQPI